MQLKMQLHKNLLRSVRRGDEQERLFPQPENKNNKSFLKIVLFEFKAACAGMTHNVKRVYEVVAIKKRQFQLTTKAK
jgi:hypothetical protein